MLTKGCLSRRRRSHIQLNLVYPCPVVFARQLAIINMHTRQLDKDALRQGAEDWVQYATYSKLLNTVLKKETACGSDSQMELNL